MLDEPFAGIDPVTVQSIQIIIKSLATDGIAVLITDHAAREILQITDRTYVVSEGQVLCSGSQEEILSNPEVRRKISRRHRNTGHTTCSKSNFATDLSSKHTNSEREEIGAQSRQDPPVVRTFNRAIPRRSNIRRQNFCKHPHQQRGLDAAEQEVVAALNAGRPRRPPAAMSEFPTDPKIVIADADHPVKKRKSFFKSNDLD